jgi:hypothetical protein
VSESQANLRSTRAKRVTVSARLALSLTPAAAVVFVLDG